jgi:hypothetical protein
MIAEAGVTVPASVRDADVLTDFASMGRYPGAAEVGSAGLQRARLLAEIVV